MFESATPNWAFNCLIDDASDYAINPRVNAKIIFFMFIYINL